MPRRLSRAQFAFVWLVIASRIKEELMASIRRGDDIEDLLRLQEALEAIFVRGERRALPSASFGLSLDPTEGGWLTTKAEGGVSRRGFLSGGLAGEASLGDPDTLNEQIDKTLLRLDPFR